MNYLFLFFKYPVKLLYILSGKLFQFFVIIFYFYLFILSFNFFNITEDVGLKKLFSYRNASFVDTETNNSSKNENGENIELGP